MSSPSRFLPFAGLTLVLAIFLAGCGGHRPQRDTDSAPPLGPNGKPLPVLKAEGPFSNGQLVADVVLGRGWGKGGFKPAPIPGMPSKDDSSDDQNKPLSADTLDALRHRRAESPLPPVQLRLKLTNAATVPLQVEIIDFKSDLGDFAVEPDHFTIAPGTSSEPDPMISRLGVTSTEIPVTVSLRINGKNETHVLTLRPVGEPPGPPLP